MSTSLREGVHRLDITTRVTLGVLALASGVYTYLGVRELLDGNATLVILAAVIYSVAVSIGIYAFWSFLMRFMPHVRDNGSRLLLFGCMLLGSVMIVAMSAWLNATALAGSKALEQHLSTTLQSYTRDLDRANNNALAAQGLKPDIEMAAKRFATLGNSERTGALTGTSGSGTVVQLLNQMSAQLGGLSQELNQSSDKVKALYEQGGKHIATMRELVSGTNPIKQRSDAFGSESLALIGVIASLNQTSVAPAVKRAADGLSAGFIAPAADGRDMNLVTRQNEVVGRVEGAVAAQAKALSQAADKILSIPTVEPTRYKPMSTAEAVLVYASDFLPSWAGAISIDLMPGVLVLILCVVHAGIRREGDPVASASTMTAADLVLALSMAREVEDAQGRDRPAKASESAPAPAEPAEAPEPSPAPAVGRDDKVMALNAVRA
jgi:hypothetical protein